MTDSMREPECPYCYSGKIVKDKTTNVLFCNRCFREVFTTTFGDDEKWKKKHQK